MHVYNWDVLAYTLSTFAEWSNIAPGETLPYAFMLVRYRQQVRLAPGDPEALEDPVAR